MQMLFRRRRQELAEKKLGPIYASDPKIILVQMLRRPHRFPDGSHMVNIMSIRPMFNSLLNDAAKHYQLNVLYHDTCGDSNQFDRMGN